MFQWDGPFMRVIRTICDYVFTAILITICSLPLFTFGAAMCAGYDTIRRYIVGERGQSVLSVFFHSFAKNFKQSTAIWLICGAVLVLFWQSLRVMDALGYMGTAALVMQGISIIAMVITTAVLLCALASVVRFTNKVGAILKNSVMLCFMNMGRLALLLIWIVLIGVFVYVIPPVVLIAPALIAFYWYRCMEKIFAPYLPKKGKEDPA